MSLLLDTCTFLYLIDDYEQVPAPVFERIETEALFISTVSLWEILIKTGKGRLHIDTGRDSMQTFWETQCEALDTRVLGVHPGDVLHLPALPATHQDPFDRLLICQAIEHGLAIVTPDKAIRQYPIKTIWD